MAGGCGPWKELRGEAGGHQRGRRPHASVCVRCALTAPEAPGLASARSLKFLTFDCFPLPPFALLGPGQRPGRPLCAPRSHGKAWGGRGSRPACLRLPPLHPAPPRWRRGSAAAWGALPGGATGAGALQAPAGFPETWPGASEALDLRRARQELRCVLPVGCGRRPKALSGLVPVCQWGAGGAGLQGKDVGTRVLSPPPPLWPLLTGPSP